MAYTRFKADKDIMDALVHLTKKTGARGWGGATSGEPALETSLWGIPYADDAGVVSQSTEKLRKIMEVIVVVCAALASPYRRLTLRSSVYAQRRCRNSPPYSA